MSRNIVLVDPLPRTLDLIMEPKIRARLEALGEVVISEEHQMPDAQVDDKAIVIMASDPHSTDPFLALAEERP